MNRSRALLAVCFCAGMLGGLAYGVAAWLCSSWGVTTLAGVHLAAAFNRPWLYQHLVWGGIWGAIYFPTVATAKARRNWVRKALWVSLLPTLIQLLVIYPYRTPYGPLGMGLGTLTPLFVLLFNFVWGFFTGTFARALWGRG